MTHDADFQTPFPNCHLHCGRASRGGVRLCTPFARPPAVRGSQSLPYRCVAGVDWMGRALRHICIFHCGACVQLVITAGWAFSFIRRTGLGVLVACLVTGLTASQLSKRLRRALLEATRAEEARRRSEGYLAEAQRMTHTGSWAWAPASGGDLYDWHYWSEEMFCIFELDRHLGPPTREIWWQRIHPDDREPISDSIHKALREKGEYVNDYRILLPDGRLKYIHAIGHPVFNDAGEIVEFVGTSVDVTESKHSEAERERLRQLETDLAHMNRVSIMGELAGSLGHEIKTANCRGHHQRQHLLAMAEARAARFTRSARSRIKNN